MQSGVPGCNVAVQALHMSNTPFLAKATALMFLITGVALFAFRDHNPYWAPLFAACFAGIAAATTVGMISHRRGGATRTTTPADTTTSEARPAGA
ncbi:MAG: hypothetical protein NVSMB29_18380 [Candidatus Dormibacteria bacterium]